MNILDILAWIAAFILPFTALPQIILNFKRKSAEGVSWFMFGLMFSLMLILAIHSFVNEVPWQIRVNFAIGAFVSFTINLQLFWFRVIRKHGGKA